MSGVTASSSAATRSKGSRLRSARLTTTAPSLAATSVQVLTNAGALDRDKQIAVVEQLTALVAEAAADPGLARKTWVLLTEAAPGGWGLWGHAHTNDELVAAARAEIAALKGAG
jgi:phenylpyruvate tautomerase PptA (4-oxalocrotonate tautomerase family)